MTEPSNLIEDIEILCWSMLRGTHSDIDHALTSALDRMLGTADRSDHAVLESIIDGIRWGFNAAATVELGGGTMIRLRAPRGVCITHEWLGTPSEAQKVMVRQSVESAIEGRVS